MNVATPDVLNITELLSGVENDHELVSELFFIFKSVFPSHLQRLSDAVANQLPEQVEAESYTLKGMLELDGAAVCREVREKKDQGYVDMILLTSKGLKTDIVRCRRLLDQGVRQRGTKSPAPNRSTDSSP